MKFEIKNRYTGEVQFTAEINCSEDAGYGIKLGLAVKAAIKSKANLRSANLAYANLRYANLRSANLAYANLRYANLTSANLAYANLRSANLRSANLTSANLAYANLRSANLRSANLRSADLRSFKACLWMTLTKFRDEVPALLVALKDGRVNGSTYSGECACLIGTIGNAREAKGLSSNVDRNSSDPSERWFLMIKEGDKPVDDSGGGFASRLAVEWIEEWQSLQPEVNELKL